MILGPLAVALALALAGPDALVAAHDRGDLDEVARQAGRLGAAGVGPMLAGPHADAAIAAAPAVPDGWELLGELAAVAGGWDRGRAAPAARAAARIADRLGSAQDRDLDDGVLADAGAAWAKLAARTDRWADVRVHALEVAAGVARAREAGLGYDLDAMLADADPEVRRAAAELVPAPVPDGARAALARAAAGDAEPVVALAAAGALCADTAAADPAPVLAALGPAGLERVRALARTPPPGGSPAALLDAARCLVADGTPPSRAALRALAARAPRVIRGPLARLGRAR